MLILEKFIRNAVHSLGKCVTLLGIFTKLIINVIYVFINEKLKSFRNSFRFVSRNFQWMNQKAFFFPKCLH
jgi:hypothetical protein